jgi:hypothetical protein
VPASSSRSLNVREEVLNNPRCFRRTTTDSGREDSIGDQRGKGFGHFHHTAYHIALAYAIMNKQSEAINWLESTADGGFPCYVLFETDHNLDNLRQHPRFKDLHGKTQTAVAVLQHDCRLELEQVQNTLFL